MKKIITLILMILTLSLTACSSGFSVIEEGYADPTKISFTLIIEDAVGEEVYNSGISYKTGSYALYIPILEVLREEGISYSEINGIYDDFFGIPSIDNSRWVLYVNDEEKDLNKLTKVAEEDTVKITYLK